MKSRPTACEPLSVSTIGDRRLEQVAAAVSHGDETLAAVVGRMHATLDRFRRSHGYGRALAAPQVGIGKRIIAMNLGAHPFVLLNPEITWRSDEFFEVWDDCLSIPDRIVRVRRHRSISVRYRDQQWRERNWNHLSMDTSELVQHEIDHLDGILMLKRASGDNAIRPIEEHSTLVGAGRPTHRLSLDRIARAAESIDPAFRASPQFECEALNRVLGCRVTLKLETANPIRSFKGRGADFFLQEAIRRGDQRQMVCASAGNFGQAMAYATRQRGQRVVVFASRQANPLKLEQMRGLGADLRLAGEDFDAAKSEARRFAEEQNALMVEDGREPEISEGAGSIAVELLQYDPAFDHLLLPLGNGALLNGNARWVKASSPSTIVIGVCAEGADCMRRSFAKNAVVESTSVQTIADGIAVRVPVPESVADMRGIVDDVRAVSDVNIIEAMRLLFACAGLLVEPAGVAGLAAILAAPDDFANRKIAVVLCGGNLTSDQVRDWTR